MRHKKIGVYYLVEPLGSDSIGKSFLAVNPRTQEKRVFKLFFGEFWSKDTAYENFFRETDYIGRLRHPGIIKILDYGIFENGCYYSMEFVPGRNLKKLLMRTKMAAEDGAELFHKICRAMAYAHEKGVVHRNLKPSSILLDRAGEPVIADFDIAGAAGFKASGVARSGSVLGDIAYQAPELRSGSGGAGQKSDVYALGAIFYEMLMGFPPLGCFPWPVDVLPDFPWRLQSVLQNCLASDPEHRYEHAGRMEQELGLFRLHGPDRRGVETSEPEARDRLDTDDHVAPRVRTDRIESWFCVLRNGTARERLATLRSMITEIEPSEARAILKLYAEEDDRVRCGLIWLLGELKIQAATPLILSDLKNPFHAGIALEALGKIGSEEAYNAIREYVLEHPESAIRALLPLARTGKQKGIRYLRRYLNHKMPALRRAAAEALSVVLCRESLHVLKEQLRVEKDEQVRSALFQAVHSLQSALLT